MLESKIMKKWQAILRAIGLIVLLNIFPFVRGCDDVEGLHETAGLPLPYFAYSTSSFDLSTLQPHLFGINLAVLCVLACVFFALRVRASAVLISGRFFLAVVVLAIFLKVYGNVFVFMPLILLCVGLSEVFENISMVLTIDIGARVLFLLLLCYLIAKGRKRKDSNKILEGIDANAPNPQN